MLLLIAVYRRFNCAWLGNCCCAIYTFETLLAASANDTIEQWAFNVMSARLFVVAHFMTDASVMTTEQTRRPLCLPMQFEKHIMEVCSSSKAHHGSLNNCQGVRTRLTEDIYTQLLSGGMPGQVTVHILAPFLQQRQSSTPGPSCAHTDEGCA